MNCTICKEKAECKQCIYDICSHKPCKDCSINNYCVYCYRCMKRCHYCNTYINLEYDYYSNNGNEFYCDQCEIAN